MSKHFYALCGAFDRHNYGDILFPLLHGHVIRQNLGGQAEIRYYSVKEADLSEFGGVKADSMKSLYLRIHKEPERHHVIFCGGDVLSADWVTMLGHHLPSDFLCRTLAAGRRLLGSKLANHWLRLAFRQPSKFPYVMDPKEAVASIHYTGVGASGFNVSRDPQHCISVAALLEGADSLSVRDQTAVELLSTLDVPARLVPDTALIMSDIFPEEKLAELAWQDKLETCHGFDPDNYVVFQAARIHLEHEQGSVAQQLADLYASSNLSVLLLPIGRAVGHSDAQVLQTLFQELDKRGIPCALQQSPHVLHIMASLAFSSGYIGTSLHGAISAYAFGHKVCGIATRRVKKLQAFLETWMKPIDAVSVQGTRFLEPFIELISSGKSVTGAEELAKQKLMVYADMNRYLPEHTGDI
ncbi:polysaccharide pyruvyl transferase family protein [Halomonas sp.]|uniref:polysaccharide pyruvyl transferase family protein n=1 Tax=Halomonas sp. TaxID=1486246 RepID=UPI00384C9791